MKQFHEDHGRFPLHAYAADQCVASQGRQDQLRVLTAGERERLMGYPDGWTQPLRARGPKEDARCHAIGNGFHIPSILLIITIMLQPTSATTHTHTMQDGDWKQKHTAGTIFQDARAQTNDTTVSSEELLDDVCSMFSPDFFPQTRLRRARKRLAQVDWPELSYWRRWSGTNHPLADTGGPDTDAIRNRTGLHQATSRQKNVAGARWTPTTRLPQDLSKEEHMAEALELDHPFQLHAKVEKDVVFAIEACISFGPDATGWRNRVIRSIRQLARAFAPMDEWALSHRPTRHCPGWAPALTAAFIHLLQ